MASLCVVCYCYCCCLGGESFVCSVVLYSSLYNLNSLLSGTHQETVRRNLHMFFFQLFRNILVAHFGRVLLSQQHSFSLNAHFLCQPPTKFRSSDHYLLPHRVMSRLYRFCSLVDLRRSWDYRELILFLHKPGILHSFMGAYTVPWREHCGTSSTQVQQPAICFSACTVWAFLLLQ